MARMKIVLRQAIPNVGEAGDIVSVAGGYARNYLIPQGFAVLANKGTIKQAERWRESREAIEARREAEANALKAKLEGAPVPVAAKAGPEGRLFGSVTAAHVAKAISETLEVKIDRLDIALSEPIRTTGMHEVAISLHDDLTATVTVNVASD